VTTNGAVTAQEPKKRNRFADGGQGPRLPLSDGDWVAVRKELTYGQQRRLAAAGLTGIDQAAAEGERLKVDLAAYDIERLVTWVVDWSFTGADGEAVYVSREAIEALHPDTAAEVNAALDAHIAGLEAKKDPAPGGPTRPRATSSSAGRSGGAGPT